MKTLRLFAILIITALPLMGQGISKTGTTAAQFLKISPGARSVALGGAFVSIADDASALWWNPAGIAEMDGNGLIFNHSNWLAGMSYDYFGVTYNLAGLGVLGVAVSYFSVGEMERTTELKPDGTGEYFDASNFSFALTFARKLTDDFSFGLTAKYVQENIYHMSSNTIAFDVGMRYVTPFNGLRLGMAMRNYGTKMQLSGDDDIAPIDIWDDFDGNNLATNAHLALGSFDIPLNFNVGLSYEVLQAENYRLTIASDAVIPNDNFNYVNAGAEFAFNEMFFVRGGFNKLFLDSNEGGMTLGGGLDFDISQFGLVLDYAYEDYGKLNNIQKFTLILKY